VIETGTFDELVAKGGRFAELAKAQFMVQENVRAGMQSPSAGDAAVKA
jgi:ATP-binding cassette subfamily B protein